MMLNINMKYVLVRMNLDKITIRYQVTFAMNGSDGKPQTINEVKTKEME